MKKIYLLALAFCLSASVAQAQFYNTGTANHSGQTMVYFGVENITSTPTFMHADNSLWGYTDVTPTSLKHSPGFAFLITGGGLREITENFKFGAMFGIGFSKNSLEAEFKASTIGGLNDYVVDVKTNLIDIQLGIEGEVMPVEKVGIDFAAAPYFQFLFGGKTKAEQYVASTGVLIEDATANQWHDVTSGDFNMPNMDIGVLGRIGVNYHFTETFYAGIMAQMRFPLFNTGFDDISDIRKGLDYGFRYAETKRKSWAVMAGIGINID